MASATVPTAAVERTASRGPLAVLFAVLKPLASLQLTVVLLALSVALVFFGTLAQKTDGIWTVVDKFFHPAAIVSWVEFQHLVHFGQIFGLGLVSPDATVEGRFPIPGGGLIGWLMFLNLLAAHVTRFKLTWKRAGVYVLHAGLLLLFAGEYVTRMYQVEQQMSISEGQSTNVAIDGRAYEVAFARPDGDAVRVTAVPVKRLQDGQAAEDSELPVSVRLVEFFPNSKLVPAGAGNKATAGGGLTDMAVSEPEVSGTDTSNKTNVPSAYIKLTHAETKADLGVWLVSPYLKPQPVPLGDGWTVELRPVHHYKPYTLTLTKFDFEQYTGTQMAKNYASHLTLTDPDRGPDRTVVVSMNEPLRYRGETYYQHQFSQTPAGRTTVLQVVRNPGWLIPYVSCVMITLGMLGHFLIGLTAFIGRTGKAKPVVAAAAPTLSRAERLIPWIAVGLAAVVLLYMANKRPPDGPLDLSEVARLPVVDGGRVKPLDTVARVNLRLISHRETYTDVNDKTRPAIHWLMETASSADISDGPIGKAKLFRVENDRLIELIGQQRRDGLRYSFAEIRPKIGELLDAARKAKQIDDKHREPFDQKAIELARHLDQAFAVFTGQLPSVLPPDGKNDWRTRRDAGEQAEDRLLDKMAAQFGRRFQSLGQVREVLAGVEDKEQRLKVLAGLDAHLREVEAEDKALAAWTAVLSAYSSGKQDRLDKAVSDYRAATADRVSDGDRAKVRFEAFLNDTALFYNIEFLYLLAFLLTLGGWVSRTFDGGLGEAWRRAAFRVLLLTVAVHTFTLFARMYLMGRPLVFVTNLYSSAVFIGWAAAALCLLIERLFPLGLGNAVAAASGGLTAIVAHNLAAGGDTLEMMQAVLDTNFWLATHVTTVTLGYAATYVAGLIGLGYVVAGIFTPALRTPFTLGVGERAKQIDVGRAVGMVMYGVVCFAALLSFVGTVLGGIWADQSWGRFWGWDPKENGAILIVAWNALILHARWCGLVKDRGMAVLALVGNMITTWSWFGTNQLGVGLHAYGFSNTLALGCTVTWIIHLGLIGVGLMPKRLWASFRPA